MRVAALACALLLAGCTVRGDSRQAFSDQAGAVCRDTASRTLDLYTEAPLDVPPDAARWHEFLGRVASLNDERIRRLEALDDPVPGFDGFLDALREHQRLLAVARDAAASGDLGTMQRSLQRVEAYGPQVAAAAGRAGLPDCTGTVTTTRTS